MKLLVRILVAIALGIGLGCLMPEWLGRVFVTFNVFFSQFLGFLIPLLILGFVAPSIGDLGSKAGKMLAVTAAIAYGMTVASGMFAYGVGAWSFPKLLAGSENFASGIAGEGASEAGALSPYFGMEIPPLFGVTSALVLAFVIGLGIAYTGS